MRKAIRKRFRQLLGASWQIGQKIWRTVSLSGTTISKGCRWGDSYLQSNGTQRTEPWQACNLRQEDFFSEIPSLCLCDCRPTGGCEAVNLVDGHNLMWRRHWECKEEKKKKKNQWACGGWMLFIYYCLMKHNKMKPLNLSKCPKEPEVWLWLG